MILYSARRNISLCRKIKGPGKTSYYLGKRAGNTLGEVYWLSVASFGARESKQASRVPSALKVISSIKEVIYTLGAEVSVESDNRLRTMCRGLCYQVSRANTNCISEAVDRTILAGKVAVSLNSKDHNDAPHHRLLELRLYTLDCLT